MTLWFVNGKRVPPPAPIQKSRTWTPAEIRAECLKAIDAYAAKKPDGYYYNWPFDSVAKYDWGYRVHVACVRAFHAANTSGLPTVELIQFHRDWVAREGTIEAASSVKDPE